MRHTGEKHEEFNWVKIFRVSSRARDNERLWDACIWGWKKARKKERKEKKRMKFSRSWSIAFLRSASRISHERRLVVGGKAKNEKHQHYCRLFLSIVPYRGRIFFNCKTSFSFCFLLFIAWISCFSPGSCLLIYKYVVIFWIQYQ